jgi:hypothetical protein
MPRASVWTTKNEENAMSGLATFWENRFWTLWEFLGSRMIDKDHGRAGRMIRASRGFANGRRKPWDDNPG